MQKTEIKTVNKDKIAEVNLNFLLEGMLFLAVAGIAGAYALNVESSVRSTFTANSLEYNATSNAMTGISNVTAEFDLVGTIVVAIVILGLIFGLFQFVRN